MLTWLEAPWPSELNVASLCWRLEVLQVLILNVIFGLSQDNYPITGWSFETIL